MDLGRGVGALAKDGARRGRIEPGGRLLEALTLRGLRLTRQRRAVLEVIERSKSHLDVAAILERARCLDATVHKVTVYRTLETLKKHGLIDELDLMHVAGGGHFYESRGETNHAHATCLRCGRVQEVEMPALERLKGRIAREIDMSISVARFELGGLCAACRPR